MFTFKLELVMLTFSVTLDCTIVAFTFRLELVTFTFKVTDDDAMLTFSVIDCAATSIFNGMGVPVELTLFVIFTAIDWAAMFTFSCELVMFTLRLEFVTLTFNVTFDCTIVALTLMLEFVMFTLRVIDEDAMFTLSVML